ncbi:MAG: bifunctional metallophosphatase/5'-nucleotidase [Planctomycetota bacterium]|nr:bifunctional metallophosphatase/5'-nucleotidase [Planctomycetota bacterium]
MTMLGKTILAISGALAVAAAPVLAKPAAASGRSGVTPAVQSDGSVVFWLHILHNADGESQLINAGAGQLANFGGVARFKTVVDGLRAQSGVFPADAVEKGSIMVSAGDNFLAGPEFNASLTDGVPYYDSIAMDLIGFDAACIGNHEFDFGPDVFSSFVQGFSSSVPFLSSNLNFTNEPALQAQVNDGKIARSTVVTVGSQKIGIIGATTTDLPFISTPRNVIVGAVLPAVQAEVAALQAMVPPVDKIVLISHLQGLTSEAALVPLLSGVDVVVGGGGGELLADAGDLLVPGDSATGAIAGLTGTGYPRTALDADGKTVFVVATRGDYRYVGRLIVGFDAAGNVVSVLPESGPVRVSAVAPDAVLPDATLQSLVVDPVAAAVAGLASTVIGTSDVGLDGRTTEIRSVETNLGSLATDALLYSAQRLAPAFNAPVADVAVQNGGGIRNNSIIPAGNFTELNTFEVLPFANFLSVVPNVPAAQFKEILENAVSRVGASGNGRFAQISGFRFTWNAAGVAQVVDNSGVVLTPGTRVREVILNDGRVLVRNGAVVPGAPSVNVATIDFLARGGDQYPFRGRPFINLGLSYQQALDEYIVQLLAGSIRSVDYPVGGQGRIIRQTTPLSFGPVVSNFGKSYDYDAPNADIVGTGDVNYDGTVDMRDLIEVINSRR